ncbi:MAG: Asr1405/Asl0597 family protein [Cyanobacteria bacterium P01_F01_bin.53]
MESADADYLSASDRLTIEIEVDRIARWDVYFYLQALSIPCECKCNQPLRVQIDTTNTALQLWSLVRVFTAPKQQCVEHLEQCWQKTFIEN